jgi:peptidoglycan pentaglycine glycine transferase (the first glycine)
MIGTGSHPDGRGREVDRSGGRFRVVTSQNHDDPAWDAFVGEAPGGHHVQTSLWGEVKREAGWDVVRFVAWMGDEIVGGGQISTKLVAGLGRIGFLDRGPLAVAEPEVRGRVVDAIDDVVRAHRIRMLVVQPPETDPAMAECLGSAEFGDSHIKTSLGATVVVDLEPTMEQMLASMKSKTRYNVRKALKSPLSVRVGDAGDLETFHAMLADTGRRQGFTPMSVGQLEAMHRSLAPSGGFELLLAELEGEAVAGIVTIGFADRVVYKRGAWGGCHGEHRPNERLHWEAMARAKQRGFRFYDFDGIERDAAEAVLNGHPVPAEAVESVTRFKLGFGGEVVLLPAARTYLPNRPLRWVHDVVYPRISELRSVKRLVRRLRVA